jgi:DNA repair protein RecN (Recombination protein N)
LQLQQRIDEIQRVMNKHRKLTDEELIEFQNELRETLDSISNSDEHLLKLSGEFELIHSQLQNEASVLSQLRKETAKKLSPVITNDLRSLGMPDADLSINISKAELGLLGQDRIEIGFTSNKGQQPQDIGKVASGGELSRLMLSVKAEIANTTKLPSIIFDEIDTGVSGDVADKVGQKIKNLSSHLQVLCITHLPQIASKADQHLFVYKAEEEGRTVTRIRELNSSDRIIEIAKMLSTANPTEAAITHAKNLINEK